MILYESDFELKIEGIKVKFIQDPRPDIHISNLQEQVLKTFQPRDVLKFRERFNAETNDFKTCVTLRNVWLMANEGYNYPVIDERIDFKAKFNALLKRLRVWPDFDEAKFQDYFRHKYGHRDFPTFNPSSSNFKEAQKVLLSSDTAVAKKYSSLLQSFISFLLFDALDQFQMQISARRAKTRQQAPGYLYVLTSERGTKIGKAKRLSQKGLPLGVNMSFPYEFAIVKHVKAARNQQKIIHNKFASSRIKGEWFHISKTEIQLIESYLETGKWS